MSDLLTGTRRDSVSPALSASFGLALSVVLPVGFAALCWLFGLTATAWTYPVCLALSLLAVWRLSGSWTALLGVLLYSAAAILLAGLLSDYAYDSVRYHKVAVAIIGDGWNPTDYAHAPDVSLWAIHYAKLLEVWGSQLYMLTGCLEQGKAVNLILLGSAAAAVWDVLGVLGLSGRRRAAVLFVWVCNPVLTTQLPTFYIDFSLYLYLTLTLVLVVNLALGRHMRLSLLFLLAVTVMAVGTKFNIFFIQGVALAAAIGWLAWRRRWRAARGVTLVGLTALALAPVVFYHPYITNWLGWGHPFYPLMGDDTIDIMTINTPALYEGHNRFVNFVLNLVSPNTRHFPFTSYASSVSGFTLVGGVLFVCSVVVLAVGWGRFPAAAYYVAAVTVVSCFFFEQAWWARYIPQLWLLPVVALFCEVRWPGRGSRWMAWVFVVLAFAALCLSGLPQLYMHVSRSL